MKRFFLMLLCCVALTGRAQQEVKYCMTYEDFYADNWRPIEELTGGRSKKDCEIKFTNDMFQFKTGDKEADKIVKKQVLAIMFGDQLFVNCRNLKSNDITLDVTDYGKAFRFDGNKICLLGYKANTAAVLASIGADVASIAVNSRWLSTALLTGSTTLLLDKKLWHRYACFLLDSEADEKGKIYIKSINDQMMQELLADRPDLLEKYMSETSKSKRQKASNIIPILVEKGYIEPIPDNETSE